LKSADTQRVAILTKALYAIDDLSKAIVKVDGYDFAGAELGVGAFDWNGDCSSTASIVVDHETGLKIVAAAKQLILAELATLGVTLEAELAAGAIAGLAR
jgi:hypothetical protein